MAGNVSTSCSIQDKSRKLQCAAELRGRSQGAWEMYHRCHTCCTEVPYCPFLCIHSFTLPSIMSFVQLGRWVHYQRVEHVSFQQQGVGKITPFRIQKLESIGFDFDPLETQWKSMCRRLIEYKVW